MTDKQTLSESKRIFHKTFPYIIPALYRRLADELLVELHLLSQKNDFKQNGLFAIGLTTVFSKFTEGYKPKDHLEKLFEALCSSTGLNSNELITTAERLISEAKSQNLSEIKKLFLEEASEAPISLKNEIHSIRANNLNYTRLYSIGILTLLNEAKKDSDESSEVYKIAPKLSEGIGFSISRVEKDLLIYKSGLEKQNQAIELIQETISREKKKNLKRIEEKKI